MTVDEIKMRHNEYLQAWAERWHEEETPPDPTWNDVGELLAELDRIEWIISDVRSAIDPEGLGESFADRAIAEIVHRMNTNEGDEA